MATRRVSDTKKSAKPVVEKPIPQHLKARSGTAGRSLVSEDQRRGMIAYSAYLRGERRGFAPGGEAEDWLLAEQEVDALLSSGHMPAQ